MYDHIQFGHYEQDDDLTNGTEPILWRVLAEEDGKALVISEYALDIRPYNEEEGGITWEESTLREWLNGPFYEAAFDSDEQAQIAITHVDNEGNPTTGVEGGNDTEDKVFLLSITEAMEYFESEDARKAFLTESAAANGAYMDSAPCIWWLRSPGVFGDLAACIETDGYVNEVGSELYFDYVCVRPALWINLEP